MYGFAIGLGSNQEDPERQVRRAILRLRAELVVTAVSSCYRTSAWGVTDQDDFVNAVVLADFAGHPQLLMAWLLQVEEDFGRRRAVRWGPRTLDLDLLTWRVPGEDRELTYEGHELEIPHPGILVRPFVLAPLLEVIPGWRHPVTGTAGLDAWWSLPGEERRGVRRLPGADRGEGGSEIPALREHVHALGLSEG